MNAPRRRGSESLRELMSQNTHLTAQELADDLKMNAQYIRQVAKRNNIQLKPLVTSADEMRSRYDFISRNLDKTTAQLATMMSISPASVYDICKRYDVWPKMRRSKKLTTGHGAKQEQASIAKKRNDIIAMRWA